MSNNGKQSKHGATAATNGKATATPTTNNIAVGGVIDEKQIAAPDGFAPVFGERVLGWFLPEAGNIIQGTLKDVFETDSKFSKRDESKKKRVYKIEVTAISPTHPTYYIPADADDARQSAKVGDLIGLDEKGWLKSLGRVLGQEVWVACLGKESPSAEYPQGAWKYKVHAKPAKTDAVTGEVTS
jgi:hypothetical protein